MKGLANARKQLGITQKEASEQLGIPLSTLRRWEQGVNEPDAASISRMADFYDVSTDYILGSSHARVKDELAPDETAVVRNMRRMAPEGRAALLATSDALAAQFPLRPAENCGGGCSMPEEAETK